METYPDEYQLGDFVAHGQRHFSDEYNAIAKNEMWPTVEKIVEHKGIRHPRMDFVCLGSYHLRGSDQQAFARSNGHSVELYHGSPDHNIITPIKEYAENKVYYKTPYLYVSGGQEARSKSKSRLTGRARAEFMVHFVFLMKHEISTIHNKDNQDLLSEFESICRNFEQIKEEEGRKAAENSRHPKLRDYRPGGGTNVGGRYMSSLSTPSPRVKREPGLSFGSVIKSEPDSDDELGFSSRFSWSNAQSSRAGTASSHRLPSISSTYTYKTSTLHDNITPTSSFMNDWRAGLDKDDCFTPTKVQTSMASPKTPRKRTATDLQEARLSKGSERPRKFSRYADSEFGSSSASTTDASVDKFSPPIKKEQEEGDGVLPYGGSDFARSFYQHGFDLEELRKKNGPENPIELN